MFLLSLKTVKMKNNTKTYQALLEEERRLKSQIDASNTRIVEEFNQSIQPSYLFNTLIKEPVLEKIRVQKRTSIIESTFDFVYNKTFQLLSPKEGHEDKEWKQTVRENLKSLYESNRSNLTTIATLLIDRQLNRLFSSRKKD